MNPVCDQRPRRIPKTTLAILLAALAVLCALPPLGVWLCGRVFPTQPVLAENTFIGFVSPGGCRIELSGCRIEPPDLLQIEFPEPKASVQLACTCGTQPITGIYLVCDDGTIELCGYGTVHVAGKTLAEATQAIEAHLSQFLDAAEVRVALAGYNSKVCYIVTEGAGLGDNVMRMPWTGEETVLDAISQVNLPSQLSDTRICIVRPGPAGAGCEQVLPVDWPAICRGGSCATNYPLLPGDRVFISDDTPIRAGIFVPDSLWEKLASAVEWLFGIDIGTARSSQTMGRDYNRCRSL